MRVGGKILTVETKEWKIILLIKYEGSVDFKLYFQTGVPWP